MSTFAKVVLGVGACFGVILLVVAVIVFAAFLSADDDAASSAPTTVEESAQEEVTEDEEEPAAEEQGVSMTATQSGTTGDVIDDTVYTVVDVEITNNGDEPFDVNPMYFTTVLSDGTERNDWGEAIFADITHFATGDLAPGDSTSGQIAVVGEVSVTELRYEPIFGVGDPIVVPVG
ncbi:DUF4352 domain-containing protein [Nocardiopsis sp. ATB16-24]|uniref:DUF4352 domain-containing protein n=1 Tax=Nocardiopsis sp. ATB16-24 TaxID=3019555 RepID=UPI002555C9E7|nr:DUF4352 domain-containing protein [Nocardiopsis sp. ATB16-24]